LAALATGIRQNLPIVVKWLAFGQICYENGQKSKGQCATYDVQRDVVGSPPERARQALKEIKDGELENPQAEGAYELASAYSS
jgi:hypothetical protein